MSAGDARGASGQHRTDDSDSGGDGAVEQLRQPTVLREAAQAELVNKQRQYTKGLNLSLDGLGASSSDLSAAVGYHHHQQQQQQEPQPIGGGGLSALLPNEAERRRRAVFPSEARPVTASHSAPLPGGSARTNSSVGVSARQASSGCIRDSGRDENENHAGKSGGSGNGIGDGNILSAPFGLVFDPNEPRVQRDIVRMLTQYLNEYGYHASAMVLQDEANQHAKSLAAQRSHVKKMRTAILAGDWAEVERLCQKATFKNVKPFLYAVHRQQFLELIERREHGKAFALLTERLKPLESYAQRGGEFRDLCYLLTCKSVHDAPLAREWNGVQANREALVEQFRRLLDFEQSMGGGSDYVPPQRLVRLLQQAFAYQIEYSRYHPRVPPRIQTLLDDYHCFVLPNAERAPRLSGHRANVKCVEFVGSEGMAVAAGSSDNCVGVWDTESGALLGMLEGHTSRVWDVSSAPSGRLLASGSADGTVRLWSAQQASDAKHACVGVLGGAHDAGDVYSVQFHPGESHLVSGGYDKTLRLHDVRTGQVIKTFVGHQAAVSSVAFNPYGNLIISGSKDSTIKFWDIVSGVCVRTFSSHLGEVTSVACNRSGSMLVSSSKDNSNRLWDMRAARPVRRFKGHQNTSKNFVRASFGPDETLVVGGSEDGYVYIWDVESAQIVQRLRACERGAVFSAVWCRQQSLLASCGNDGDVRLWWYDPAQPLTAASTVE